MNVSNRNLRRRQLLSAVPTSNGASSGGGAVAPDRSTLSSQRRVGPAFKKRPRPTLDVGGHAGQDEHDDLAAATTSVRDVAPIAPPPLAGVVVCLSGQARDDKDRLHRTIRSLGGTAVGNFDPRVVTHLVLDAPTGPKYDFWWTHRDNGWAARLSVVTSGWVVACGQEGRQADEREHRLPQVRGEGEERATAGAGAAARDALPSAMHHASLDEQCASMLRQQDRDRAARDRCRNLFARQSLLLVNFEEGEEGAADGAASSEAWVSSRAARGAGNAMAPARREADTRKGRLSKLLRRAGGTIYWEPNEWISVVVLNERYTKRTWDDVHYFCREHPNGPICVSVDWVLTTIYNRCCAAGMSADPPPAPLFPPEPRPEDEARHPPPLQLSRPKRRPRRPVTSSVFRGDVFAVVPSKPAEGTLGIHAKTMEATLTNHGGLILSKPLLLATRQDAKAAATHNTRRNYYVVSSRWIQLNCAASFPLLAELSKMGIRVVPVSPIWVAACVKNHLVFDPEEYPHLFQPQVWAVRLWSRPPPPASTAVAPEEQGGTSRDKEFSISVTGFVDSSRYGIVAALEAIRGPGFTDNLTRRNTHLICKEAQGRKYNKAVEWGLHAVSIEWLYHILRHGYKEGSEDRFSVVTTKEDPATAKTRPLLPQLNAAIEKETVRSSLDGSLDGKHQTETSCIVDVRCGAEGPAGSVMCRAAVPASENTPNDSTGVETEKDANRAAEQRPRRHATEHPPESSSPLASPSRRCRTRALSQTLPKGARSVEDPAASERRRCALHALETTAPAAARGRSANSVSARGRPAPCRRRGKRDRSLLPAASQESVSLLSRLSEGKEEEDAEEEVTQIETQFTTGTILANADVTGGMGSSSRNRRGRYSSVSGENNNSLDVPWSQANDAEDCGESQVVWYAATR